MHGLSFPVSHRILPGVVLYLTLGACATPSPIPAPARTPPQPRAAAGPAFESQPFLCHPDVRRTSWEALKIPPALRAVDVAVAGESLHVLFNPPYVLTLSRQGEGEPKLVKPVGDFTWSSLDVDPVDGSLWIASENAYRLVRIDPQGNARPISLTGVSGDGGLREIRLGRDFLYAVPVCADEAVWIFDRTGRLVGSAFPAPEKLADVQADRAINPSYACTRVYMGRRADGELLALRPDDVRLYRANGKSWEEAGGPYDLTPPGRYAPPGDMEKLRLGEAQYLRDVVSGLFFYGDRPALLGSALFDETSEKRLGILFYKVDGQTLEPTPEACGGEAVIAVDSDRDGFVSITDRGLIVGSYLPD